MSKVAELSLEDKDLSERWSRVREDFWGDLKAQTVLAVKRLLESTLEIEVQDLIGSARWKHSLTRTTYRNGHYCRDILSGLGWIVNLKVPRVRSGRICFKALPRYLRRTRDVDTGVLKMFLAGVSTRRVQEVLAPLLGKQLMSATTVSRISKMLDREVSNFHHRPIEDEYLYLILDGVYMKVKSPVHSRRRCILVVYGIRKDGTRELIDYRLARKGESQAAWEAFLTSLKNRGLEGRILRLTLAGLGLLAYIDIGPIAQLFLPRRPRQNPHFFHILVGKL